MRTRERRALDALDRAERPAGGGAARRSSTGWRTRRQRCTSSASPPVSTRWFRARARSSARCAPPSRRVATGPVLDRLFRQALHAGKKVRAETAIAESPASVSSAAAALAQQVFGRLDGCRVLLVGAGHVAELAARSLAARGAQIVVVANRSPDRADALAARFGGAGVALEGAAERARRGRRASSPRPARPAASSDGTTWRPRCGGRKGRPLFLIDLAVPRDLDPAIHELDGCYLYDIDDLESVVAASLAGRRREAARAEAIVAEEARAVPRVAGLARGRPCDRVAPRAWAEEIRVGRARAGARAARPVRVPAGRGRVDHGPDRQQAAPSADRAAEGGGGRRGRRQLRRGRPAPVRPRRRRPGADASPARLARQPARADAGCAGGRAAARSGPGDRARSDHDRGRPRPLEAVRPDRRARRLRQGARGGAARRPDRRRRPLGEGHDLDGHGGAGRRRVPDARRPAGRAVRRGGAPSRGCGSGRRRYGGARSCSRWSPGCRSSRCAGTSTRVCASAASAGSTRSCSPPAGSTGSASRHEIGHRFEPEEVLPEAGQGALALQVRVGRGGARRCGRRRGDASPRRGRARVRGGCRRRVPGSGRRAPRRHHVWPGSSPTRTAAGSSGASGDDPGRARRGAGTAGRTIVLTRPEGRNERLAARLRELGHEVVVHPLVVVEPIETGPIDLDGYDWLVLTSATGARRAEAACQWASAAKVAAIGPRDGRGVGRGRPRRRGGDAGGLARRAAAACRAGCCSPVRRGRAAARRRARRRLRRALPHVPGRPGRAATGDLAVVASPSAARALAQLTTALPVVSIGPETTSRRAGRRARGRRPRRPTPDLEGLVAAVAEAG